MSELLNLEKSRYDVMLNFLAQILPLDLIQYVIKFYIYEFFGRLEKTIPISVPNQAQYYVVDLNRNEFVIFSRGIINHYMPLENYMLTQDIEINWGIVGCLVLSNRRIIYAYSDGTLCIYDINTYTETIKVNLKCQVILFMVKLLSDDDSLENLVIGSSAEIYLLDVKTLQCTRINNKCESVITSLTACNNGNVAFAGTNGRIQIWNPYTCSLVQILDGHTDWVASLLVFPDNNLIISVGYDDIINIWEPISGNIIHTIGSRRLAFITPLSDNLLAACEGNFIKIYSMLTGKLLNNIDHGSKVDLMFKTLDNKLVALTKYNSVYIYSVDGRQIIKLGDDITNTVKVLTNGKIVTMHSNPLLFDYNNTFINIWC